MTAHVVSRTGPGTALAAPLGVATLAVAAVGLVAAVDPNEPGHYPTCPFHAATGLWCPGCGSLRALHALAHGQVREALGFNALTVGVLPVLAVLYARWTSRSWTGSPPRCAVNPSFVWAFLGLVVTFAVIRNLPWGGVLAP